ncbi:MAG: D-alanyl-D-alanine carboxypeptidase [Chloroflexi bacterium]|nr:D-alanyl-D-alanine carboxypeptidase [Chloroflexota bacterium]
MIDKDVLRNISDTKFRRVCEEVVNSMGRFPVPGVTVGILHEDKEHIAGFGVTSIEHPLPVTADTLFQIGSNTKTYTATAIMRLVEMGKLELDAPLRTYLLDLRLADEAVTAQVTMRHLLTHTGGWVGDYFNDFGPGEDALAKMVGKLADLQQLTPLGEVWSYNNSGFYLAGRVIEAVTGKNFEAAMKELIFEPLGLSMSFFFAEDVITHRFAVGHEVLDEQPKVARPWAIPRSAAPAGGIICNIKDIFRYARFHMGDVPNGTRLLSAESLNLMQTPMLSATGISMMGLSWFIDAVEGTEFIKHGGGTNGQITAFTISPAKKFAYAAFTNSSRGDQLCQDVFKVAVKEYLGVSWPGAVPLSLPEERLTAYVGRYDSAMAVCDINLRDGGLILQVTSKGGFPTPDSPPPPSPPPVRIALYDKDRMVVLDQPMKDARGEFLRNQDGNIAWLRLGGRIKARVTTP